MQLTTDFSLEELCYSETANNMGINNIPTDPQIISNITALCVNVLQPLRDGIQNPIHINSGYRTPQLNAAIGGVTNSQHMEGKAADTTCYKNTLDWAQYILAAGIAFDQLILELYSPETDLHSGWIHLSYNAGNNRQEIWSAVKRDGQIVYERGLVVA